MNITRLFAICMAGTILSFSSFAPAQTSMATTSPEQLHQCMAQRNEYPVEAKACLIACRGITAKEANNVRINACQKAYNTFLTATGQPEGQPIPVKTYQLDALTASFSLRNGRLNRFKLVGDNSELAHHAAKVCAFKLAESQLVDFRTRFNDKVRQFKQQGKHYAYRLSGITWTEEALSTHYICHVKQMDVVAIDG